MEVKQNVVEEIKKDYKDFEKNHKQSEIKAYYKKKGINQYEIRAMYETNNMGIIKSYVCSKQELGLITEWLTQEAKAL